MDLYGYLVQKFLHNIREAFTLGIICLILFNEEHKSLGVYFTTCSYYLPHCHTANGDRLFWHDKFMEGYIYPYCIWISDLGCRSNWIIDDVICRLAK